MINKSAFDAGAGAESLRITFPLTPGRFHVGQFLSSTPLYTIENEIIDYEQVDEGIDRPNVVVVDGYVDSWTEYDRSDLLARDTAVNKYLDLPELKTPGEVRQRAIEELQNAERANSPGGTVVWMPWFTVMDKINWIDEAGNRFETRIEGLSVEFNQSLAPFQRATIDTGVLTFCPPTTDAAGYIARDLFDRTTAAGLGSSQTGGDWVIYA